MILIMFFFFLQAPLISCGSPWRAGETKKDRSPKMNSEFCYPKIFPCFEHFTIYFFMRIHYTWPRLGILGPFCNSSSKHVVFRPCFLPCCLMIFLLLVLPMNFDTTSIKKICVRNFNFRPHSLT